VLPAAAVSLLHEVADSFPTEMSYIIPLEHSIILLISHGCPKQHTKFSGSTCDKAL